MIGFRSLVALILAVVATFTVSFSAFAATSKAASYTPAQIQSIQKYVPRINELRTRMNEVENLIKQRRWVDTGAYIHGPLGTLRQDMAYLNSNLPAKQQPAARKAAKDVIGHIEAIDKASQTGNYSVAIQNYAGAVSDLDSYLQLIPKV